MTDTHSDPQALPDWWQREKQRRQLRTLVLLLLLLALIGYYYYVSVLGITGRVEGINFDTSDHIAFVRRMPDGSAALYAIRADGTDLKALTPPDDKSDKSAPAWTADGKNLLYASDLGAAGRTQIYILGSGDSKQLTYGPERKDSPVASPDSKHVAFITQGAIKTVYLNGNEVEQILPAPRAGNENAGDTAAVMGQGDPAGPYLSALFSPDGSAIAGVQELSVEGNPDAASMGAGDEVARVLLSPDQPTFVLDQGRYVSIGWFPNSRRLLVAFEERLVQTPDGDITTPNGTYTYVGGMSIWDFDKPGKPTARPLMITKGYGLMPRNVVLSPDGTKVAFEGWLVSGEGKRQLRGIYIYPIPKDPAQIFYLQGAQSAGPPPSLPARPEGVPTQPRWSPDGSRLLFELERPDNKHDLCVINSDMTNMINLTKGKDDNIQGVWSPIQRKP